MEGQELKQIWMRSSKNEEITIDQNRLMNDFKSKMERRERIVRRRDLREYITAVILVSIYTAVIIKIPFSVSSVGAFLMILSACYIVYRLYSRRKSKFTQDLFMPLKEQLLRQRAFMLGQAKLLRSVHLLYMPVFISYLIVEWGDFVLGETDGSLVALLSAKKTLVKIVSTLIMIIVGIYVTRQNRRAAQKNWQPLIDQINGIITELEKEK